MIKTTIPIPHDLDTEINLINALITKNDLFFSIYDKISEDDFLNKENAKAFKIIKDLILSGSPVDKTILCGSLPNDSILKNKLSPIIKTKKEVKEYAKILYEKRLRRDLIMISGEMMEEGMSNTDVSPESIYDKYKIKLSQIKTNDDFKPENIKIACNEHLKLIKDRMNKKSGITTGIKSLDEYLTGGFKKGDLIVIGARPSVGKTCLAAQFALASSINNAKTVFITAEMSKEEMMDRFVLMIGGFNPYDLASGTVDLQKLKKTYNILSKYNLKILELINGTSEKIISVITKENLLNGVDIIFIDYLSYLRDNEGSLNETVRIGRITKNLKSLARKLKIPVVVMSQLNRNPEHRVEKRPDLSDLRQSGDIEQEADVVLLIHRNKRIDETFEEATRLYVAKNRKGPTGTITLFFDYKRLMFHEYGNIRVQENEDKEYIG